MLGAPLACIDKEVLHQNINCLAFISHDGL